MRLCVVLCTLEFTIICLYICISAVFMNIWSQQRWKIFVFVSFFLANLMKKDFVGQRGAKIWMCGNFNPLFFVLIFFSLFLSHRRPTSQQSIDFIYVFIFIHTCIWVTRDLTFFLKEHWVNTCIFLLLFYFLICNCDIIFCWNYWHSSQYLGLS